MAQSITKEHEETQTEPILTCKECFCWLPGKKGYKCILSGKRRLGAMTACQFVDSRRMIVSLAAMEAANK